MARRRRRQQQEHHDHDDASSPDDQQSDSQQQQQEENEEPGTQPPELEKATQAAASASASSSSRRMHRKSRNGCRQCKQRHVKCDESRPRCRRCSARGAKCSFGDLLPVSGGGCGGAPLVMLGGRGWGPPRADFGRAAIPQRPHTTPMGTAAAAAAAAAGTGLVSTSSSSSSLMLSASVPADFRFTIRHLHLLHHLTATGLFLDGVFGGAGSPDMDRYLEVAASGAPYLMDELLALSALHLSTLHDDGGKDTAAAAVAVAEAYRDEAAGLQARAVQGFNAAVASAIDNDEDAARRREQDHHEEVRAEGVERIGDHDQEHNHPRAVAGFLFASLLGIHVLFDAGRMLSSSSSSSSGPTGGLSLWIDSFVQYMHIHRTGIRAATSTPTRTPGGGGGVSRTNSTRSTPRPQWEPTPSPLGTGKDHDSMSTDGSHRDDSKSGWHAIRSTEWLRRAIEPFEAEQAGTPADFAAAAASPRSSSTITTPRQQHDEKEARPEAPGRGETEEDRLSSFIRDAFPDTTSSPTSEIYREAVAALRWARSVHDRRNNSNSGGTTSLADRVGSTLAWPVVVPATYVAQLEMRRPEAMVVLAHWAQMVHEDRGFWVFGGGGDGGDDDGDDNSKKKDTGRAMMEAVAEHVGGYWARWLPEAVAGG